MSRDTPVEAGRLRVSQDELQESWREIQAELRTAVTGLTFHLWLESLELAARDRDTIYVRAPRHTRTLVEERYAPLLRDAAARALGAPVAVTVVAEDWVPPPSADAKTTPRTLQEPAFNPKYTFEQFVIGDGNRLAHAAALAVAEQPAQAYNPLFLHGPPGLGKTHLLHAVGNYLRRFGGTIAARYATSDEFTTAFVKAVRGGDIDEFRTAFRDVDVLLLDDVQFFADKVRTQEEFFHTFNALYETGCQLVVSSDRPPAEMGALERRLVERFASGLVASVEPPSIEVRLAILRKRAALDGIAGFDDATLREVARQVSSSVRALEGALIRIVAHASLRDEQPSPDLAARVLAGPQSSQRPRETTVAEIQSLTASTFGTSCQALIGRDRRPAVAFARQVAMYLTRELIGVSLPTIGAAFGGRNHSTVLHAHRKVARELTKASDLARTVLELKEQLESSAPDRAE
jgi:chromosomal replication initiator protein